MTTKIYRVFNGYMGNGYVHRIVIAESAEQAIELSRARWERGADKLEAEEVVMEDGVELEEWD